ncbi:hypothetical protein [Burkholderia ubonensis]|uniref:Uncharacterized protein n=1 Tax=Burkholderia ubonensis TaxID=101571 RepID=A0ABD4E102_9BURK|nr:hypothetical protein [Burkholderia ubonensis]KVN83472.1 hypothetical protein WJ68_16300 [Burkholderia ubonensis]
MPGNKKPRRKYRRKRTNAIAALETLNRSHVIGEVLTNFYVPLDAEDQRDVAIAFGGSIDAISKGKGTAEHMQNLACMCNVSLVLAEHGFGPEYEQDVVAALDALFRMQLRFKRTGVWGFDPIGLAALRRAFDVHTAQVEIAGQGELMAAGNEVKMRIKEGDFYREAA